MKKLIGLITKNNLN